MLRLLGLILTLVVFISAVIAIDFISARKEAAANEQPIPDFEAYLSVLRPRLIAKLTPARPTVAEPELSTDLAEMLPQPPAGWTVRTADRSDLDTLFPKNRDKLDATVARYLEDIASSKGPRGGGAAALTYTREKQTVIVKAVRHPDKSFSDPAALKAMLSAEPMFFQRGYLRIRGLDVSEETLPAEMRARLFTADIGAQIQIWILAPEGLSDQELLPFFETLDVRSLNAAVLDKEPGLGEVPVLFFAADLDEVALATYEAELAALAAERKARRTRALAALEQGNPASAADDAAATPNEVSCTEGAGGIKRCKIGD